MSEQRDLCVAACLALTGATKTYPFGEGTAVFKVCDKVFALVPVAGPASISLKCDPELAVALRGQFPAVTAGYHLNKRHWNSVTLDGSVPDGTLGEWIEDSYDLVVAGLRRADRERLTWNRLATES